MRPIQECRLLIGQHKVILLPKILQNQKHLNPQLSVNQVSSVVRILTFCQQYMRKREVCTTKGIFY